MHPLAILSPLETRVVGVLYEKQHTVPDTYPLSLNALMAGCNQKTSRHPVMEASEAEVQAALDSLRGQDLVIESSGSRVSRHAHNLGRVLKVPEQALALLVTLMLRGPQTAGELRINCERLHRFADISALEGFLEDLRDRGEGPLVVELPRQPGARENRWAHLLGGPVDMEANTSRPAETGTDITTGEVAALKARLTGLETELIELKREVARLYEELGISGRDAGETGS